MTSKIKVDNITNQSDSNIVNKCGTTITLGASGDTVTLAAGASQSGFGRTGSVNWDTTPKTTGFTAVSGNGYFCDTTSAAFTVTLPATPSGGDIVAISDYAGTFTTNNLTVARNGSNIRGSAADFTLDVTNQTVTLIYVDGTQGWNVVQESNNINNFIVATGGTETTSGDFKIHTFTGPGTFTVSSAGNPAGSTTVDYMVVAGGGGGGGAGRSGGGGAGGYRESSGAASGCYSASPLGSGVSALPVTAQGYPITVGAGGSGGIDNQCSPGVSGSNSIFSTITSAGGGGGAPIKTPQAGIAGGSGGGHGADSNTQGGNGGAGNTPPVSPPQGNSGGNAPAGSNSGAGGGGATIAGTNATPAGSLAGSPGGNGATTSISASPTAYAGGGGGGGNGEGGGNGGTGGGGDGSDSTPLNNSTAGTTNTGSGGGAGGSTGSAGGSGIVVIRYKFQ
jgi:hypothetical protein